MAKETKSSPVASLIILVVFGFILYSCVGGSSETAEEKAGRLAKEAEDKRKGFHCLSAWDGSHAELKREVKAAMRDPDSFEHIETRVTPISPEGTHTLSMKYRAKNGFGGLNIGTAFGTYRNSDCTYTILAIE